MQSNKRIDAGIPRGERQKIRREARERPSNAIKVWTHYSPEFRAKAIEAVPEAILAGKTTTQLAAELGIPAITLRSWIIGSESAESARGALLAHELMTRSADIDNADDPLTLARAREGFRAWSWIAERRESRLYGQHQQVTVTNQLNVSVELVESARALLEHVIQPESIAPIDDSEPEQT